MTFGTEGACEEYRNLDQAKGEAHWGTGTDN
jgi:hypothetical protein